MNCTHNIFLYGKGRDERGKHDCWHDGSKQKGGPCMHYYPKSLCNEDY